MAQKLLFKKLYRILNIALFVLIVLFSFEAKAQSVLLPGDIVIVSANADTQSIDIIPLIDIEKSTVLYFSNGLWDDSAKTLTGEEIQLTFNDFVQAGTNIHVNSVSDSRISINGNFSFDGVTHRLFSYQKENENYRFIFGMGWGKGNPWNTPENPNSGSDIPASLLDNSHTLLTLGKASNYQYYIRNGASGTRKLLLKFVGDEANWRGNDKKPFSAFGTSFRLLSPPVILFDQSVSIISEKDSIAVLDVAIYEHDGSRLSVEVMFDSSRSSISSDNFGNFSTTRLNFTGLVGDGVYEVRVPIIDDEVFGGRSAGIFILRNLTKGNFGDFLTHSLIVADDELPEVLISKVMNTQNSPGYIEIRNMEEAEVSLSGWSLQAGERRYNFPDYAILNPGKSLKLVDSTDEHLPDSEGSTLYSDLKSPLLSDKGGLLKLKNYQDLMINEVVYSRIKKNTENRESKREDLIVSSELGNAHQNPENQQGINSQVTILQTTRPGWKVLVSHDELLEKFANTKFYYWNEDEQLLEQINENYGFDNSRGQIIFGYFTSDEVEELSEWTYTNQLNLLTNSPTDNLTFTVSATDKNENDVIDGLEGLNLALNNLNEAIRVQRILELISSEYPELKLSSVVYGVKQKVFGELDFVRLQAEEVIAPNAPFWLKLENLQSDVEITLDREALLAQSTIVDETDITDEEPGYIEIQLTQGDHEEEIKLHIEEEGSSVKVRDLNSYPELFFQDQSFLNFAIIQGRDYFNELRLSSNIEQFVSLPVYFSTSYDGQLTFSVTGWENIPADWEITLEDKSTDKEYNLRKDFSITFEHSLTGSVDELQDESDLFEEFSQPDRFVIHISPPAEMEEEEQVDAPRELELHQNFPNPFNPVTTISFYLPESEKVRLSVFNVVGQPVAVITEGTLSAGLHEYDWDATDKPSGMYIYQLEVGKSVMTRKMTLVK